MRNTNARCYLLYEKYRFTFTYDPKRRKGNVMARAFPKVLIMGKYRSKKYGNIS